MDLGRTLRVVALGIALAAGVVPSTTAAPLVTITLPVGGVVDVPAHGTTQVSVAPADVAGAWADADHVTVWGLRQGAATLVLTWPNGVVEARPLQVGPADPQQARFANGECSDALAMAVTSPVGAALPPPTSDVRWSPGEWQAFWNLPGNDGRLTASRALDTSLGMVGVGPQPGVDLAWDRWTVTATRGVGALAYEMPLGSGMVLIVGDTTLGPIGEATVAAGDVAVSSVALFTSTGQLVTAAQTTLGLGPFGVGYLIGPSGNVPTLQFRSGSITLSAANWPSTSVGVSLGFGGGTSVQGAWGLQTGWSAEVSLSLGAGRAPMSGSTTAMTGVILPAEPCTVGLSPTPRAARL
jgi:hypothetical protein